MIALALCAAGLVGFLVGIYSNWFFASRIITNPWARCRRCMNAHIEDNHEKWENWDK